MNHIFMVGLGSYGSAMTHSLAQNSENIITTFSRDPKKSLEKSHYDLEIQPNVRHRKLSDLTDSLIGLRDCTIFLALPSSAIEEFILTFNNELVRISSRSTRIVNLAKGVVKGKLISELFENYQLRYSSLYGPSFSSDFNGNIGLTYTSSHSSDSEMIKKLFDSTNIYLDFSYNQVESDYLAILKNLYAIIFGIISTTENNFSTYNMLVTNLMKEYHSILRTISKYPNVFCYAGIGDFLLTTGSSKSRNRVLGEMISKGLMDVENGKNTIVYEGLKVLDFIQERFPTVVSAKHLKLLISSEITVDDFIKAIKCMDIRG